MALTYCHKCGSLFLSTVKSRPLKFPPAFLEKVRAGSSLKLFLIDCNPSFAFPTSQALHLSHMASRPWCAYSKKVVIRFILSFNKEILHQF